MNEYVDVDIIENGKVIGTTKVLHVTKEPETQNIKLEKVDIKTTYDNLLIKYAELGKEVRLLGERCNQLLKDKGDLTDVNSRLLSQVAATTKRVIKLEQQIEKMKSDVKQGQSYWNSCEMQYSLFQRLLDKWEKEND